MCVAGCAQYTLPNIVSLTLTRLDLLSEVVKYLLYVLEQRRRWDVGLKWLAFHSCHVRDADYVEFEELVGEIEWDDAEEMNSYCEGSEMSFDPDNMEADVRSQEPDDLDKC